MFFSKTPALCAQILSKADDKTVPRSFRISEAAFKVLQEEAERQNISVNTLLNQLVLSYTNFDRFYKKLHMLKLSAQTFRHVLNAASDQAIVEAGEAAGRNTPRALILAKSGILSLDTVIDYLRNLANYANLFEYSEALHNSMKTIALIHEFGPKGSLFLTHYVKAIFESVAIRVGLSASENAVIIEL
jgi:hypothetical protein